MHTQGNDARGARDRLPLSSIPDCEPANKHFCMLHRHAHCCKMISWT